MPCRVNNAAKYTPDGGRIELSAGRCEDGARLIVRDNGVGIPTDKLDSLFDMYTQLDQPVARGVPGLGIGLSLAKSLVELHGGHIEAQSGGPNQGSTFIVQLPAATGTTDDPLVSRSFADEFCPASAAAPDRKGPRRSVDPDYPLRRVLVVEDNEDAADSLATLLEIMGHESRIARDGLEGVAAAEVFRPQVVLLDIGLPKLDGYNVARRIRAQPVGERRHTRGTHRLGTGKHRRSRAKSRLRSASDETRDYRDAEGSIAGRR